MLPVQGQYGFDVDNPGVSYADIIIKTQLVMVNHDQLITLSKLRMINTPCIVIWSWSVASGQHKGGWMKP